MKQIHIWPNHVRITDLDLVLVTPEGEHLADTLGSLAKLGFDTHPTNVELHLGAAGSP